MSESDSSSPRSSLRRRAVNRLISTASDLGSRARLRAERSGVHSTRDHVIIEAQQATYREMHRRFTERAERGETGLNSALEALDAMWMSIRDLRSGATVLMGTLASEDDGVQAHLSRFYHESTALLGDAIRRVFAEDLGQLALAPERLAVLVRIGLEGLVVELAQAQSNADVALVDRAYGDLRQVFEQFVLLGEKSPQLEEVTLDPIPLPW